MPTNDTVRLMKNHINDLVYSSVQVEGIGATFAQTVEIIEEGQASGVPADEVQKIVCIKRSLEFLFDNYRHPLDWKLYSTYNAIIGEGLVKNPGQMRGPGTVRVNDYYPGDVSVALFDSIVGTALETAYDAAEAAAQVALNLSKAQFFHDGNKRSALVFANHLLAHEDAGRVIVVSESARDGYLDLLMDFYHGRTSLEDASWDFEEKYIVGPVNPTLQESQSRLGFGLGRDRSESGDGYPELCLDEPERGPSSYHFGRRISIPSATPSRRR